MINTIETAIKMPGLKDTLTILHIADLHVCFTDERDNEYVKSLRMERERYFPNAGIVLDQLKQYINENPPGYTVLTGDFLDFPSEKNCEVLYDFLENTCKRYLYTRGNHECFYPVESATEENQKKYYPRFFPVTNGTPDFQAVDAGGVLLIGIENTRNQISASQLDKLKDEFKKNIPCLIFMHVPVYIGTLIEDVVKVWGQPIIIGTPPEAFPGKLDPGLVPDIHTDEFCKLIREKDTPVIGIAAGHVHFAHEDFFAPNKIQYISPLCASYENTDGIIRRIHIVSE